MELDKYDLLSIKSEILEQEFAKRLNVTLNSANNIITSYLDFTDSNAVTMYINPETGIAELEVVESLETESIIVIHFDFSNYIKYTTEQQVASAFADSIVDYSLAVDNPIEVSGLFATILLLLSLRDTLNSLDYKYTVRVASFTMLNSYISYQKDNITFTFNVLNDSILDEQCFNKLYNLVSSKELLTNYLILATCRYDVSPDSKVSVALSDDGENVILTKIALNNKEYLVHRNYSLFVIDLSTKTVVTDENILDLLESKLELLKPAK